MDRAYTIAQFASGLSTPIVLALLLWKGRTPERLAAMALAVIEFGTPLFDHLIEGSVRPVIAGLSLGLFIVLVVLALRVDRWWLLAAAGFQLLAVATWAIAFIEPVPIWAGVTVRLIVWWFLLAAALFGVWESRKAPYAQPFKPA